MSPSSSVCTSQGSVCTLRQQHVLDGQRRVLHQAGRQRLSDGHQGDVQLQQAAWVLEDEMGATVILNNNNNTSSSSNSSNSSNNSTNSSNNSNSNNNNCQQLPLLMSGANDK